MNPTPLRKVLLTIIALGCAAYPAHADVWLELVNPFDLSNAPLTVNANSTFSLAVRVEGLSTPALNSFNLTVDTLPSGFHLNSFTDTIPTGWLSFPNVSSQVYGGYNWSGQDLTGNATLVQLNFTSGTASGTINFGTQGPLQNLLDNSSANIAFQQRGIAITVVPEPATTQLLAASLLLLRAIRRRRSR